MFCERGVLRNFAKVTGKHLCQSLFFLIKLQAPPEEKYFTQEKSFSFTFFSKDNLLKVIESLISDKASPFFRLPTKVLKNLIHIYPDKLI